MTELRKGDPFNDKIIATKLTFEAVDCAVEYANCGSHRLAITVSWAWLSELSEFFDAVDKLRKEHVIE